MPLLNLFGDLERFVSEVLYPYRYVITPLLVAAMLAAVYVAYRLGAHDWVRRNGLVSTAIGVPLAIVLVVSGNYFLSPLWERSFLEEASPLAVATPAATTTAVPEATAAGAAPTASPIPALETPMPAGQPAMFEPMVASRGEFVDADAFHFGRGDALIIETEPGKYVLRVENFSVRNGPDLFVYLSEDPSGRSVDEALNLGELKATDGAFNYEIPEAIDVTRIKSAVVWCRQFAVLFTHAELM